MPVRAVVATAGVGSHVKEGMGMLITKVARIVLLFGVMLSLTVAYASATPILSIEPPNQVVHPAQNFSLDVIISGVGDLYAFQFDLAFDPLIVSAMSVTEGPFLPTGGTTAFIAGTIDNSGGTIFSTADTLIGLIPGVSGAGTLATVNFEALAIGISSITLTNVALLDSNLTPIDSNTVNGTVDVVPEPATGVLLITGCAGLLALSWRRRNIVPTSRSNRSMAWSVRLALRSSVRATRVA
jgi:hypothetical protein